MNAPRWLNLDGAANARDVGGLPVTVRAGARAGVIRAGRLLRSDNLQDLSPADVRRLVDELHVDTVLDLRTGVEVRGEGPGPLSGEPAVSIHHLSLFPEPDPPARPEPGSATAQPDDDARVVLTESEAVLPWQDVDSERARTSAAATYRRYLAERPDSVLTALRLIAASRGASIVHCAAGKDRTGVVVGVALSAVGVGRSAVVADYLASADVIHAILSRLAAAPTYAADTRLADVDHHRPRAATFERFLDDLDVEFPDDRSPGALGWLRANGWTDADQAALVAALVEPDPADGC